MSKLKLLAGFLKLKLPESWVDTLSITPRPVVRGREIDTKAHLASELVGMLRDANDPPSIDESRAQLAVMARKFERPCPDAIDKTDITLPGAEGPRAARIYGGQGQDPFSQTPTLLYLHGGGWVQGSIETHDGLCGWLAHLAGIRVISYEYRLAPEHPFPAAANDILACYRALVAGDTKVAVDPATLVVGGDSAGGNLTACLMHDLVLEGRALPAGQLLIYPGMDAALSSQSMTDLRDQPLLPAARIKWYLGMYIPDGYDWLDPRISPLYSETLAYQPEAFIVAGGHDPLWDDAQSYADKLRSAGVAVTQLDYPGQIHAFMSLTRVLPQGNDAIGKTAAWLRRILKKG
ncbi:alpha/beta hydrolase [Shimia sp. SDUM112013]|uniref:alpha/beta hydrolase n=1 Tax=Shimia sp. SDUM112013 TaxID=3136160 RepID=UPI0032ED6898